MRYPDSFTVTTPGDREIEIRRSFAAPRTTLFDAFTKPELVRRWLLGPEGWTMPVCDIDLRVGGAFRYVWRKDGVKDMGMGGVFREIVPASKLVNTEVFDAAWYPGEAENTTVFVEKGATTEVTITVRYQSKEARDTASRSGMERGMSAGFDRLEELLLADEAPRVVETPPRVAAALHLVIPRAEIRSAMGPGLNEVMAAIKAQGAEPAGPWFTHHRKMDPSMFDFEICVPVTAPMHPYGRVTLLDIPATTAARMIYRGSYEGLSGAWGRLMAWIETEGHTPAPDLFECYVAGPETGIDASQWRTELVRPLIN